MQIEPARILALRAVEVPRYRNSRMPLARQSCEADDRVGDDLVDRLRLVDDPVDKRSVGAVFEEPPHQIGEQILMAPDRSIDTTRLIGTDDLVVKRLAHSVEPLKLVILALACERQDGRDGVRVVRGELRI